MSRRHWQCRNPSCSGEHGTILGRLVDDDGIVLDASVTDFGVYLDTQKAVVKCPICGTIREFRGRAVFSTLGT